MTDTITLPRSVVEQALDALQDANTMMEHRQDVKLRHSAMADLRAALEQPQVEQETVGEAGSMPGTDGFTMACFRASDVPVGTKLYTHPQPKGEQEPVAWIEHEWSGSGLRHLHFERPAPTVRDEVVRPVWTPLYPRPQPRKPLTDEAEHQCPYPKANPSTRNAWLDGWEAAERAHGIGGEA